MRRYLCLLLVACSNAEPATQNPSAEPAEIPAADALAAQDSAIAMDRFAEAKRERWDTLATGELAARFGRTFVGAPYTPGTLEAPGPERLIVNLRTFDCVTFVESSLALARALKSGDPSYAGFRRELEKIRYRDGKLDGYPSRLHYFSEWIANNEAKGIVRDITLDLGGERDPRPIHFMTSHSASYRQLSEPAVLDQIRAMEQRITQVPRHVIPEHRIAAVADRIQNGDVIAAASTLPGLDIAHTGLALWVDGKLHLMHAPLVGSHVEISEVPLAERILRQEKQNGIMVARAR